MSILSRVARVSVQSKSKRSFSSHPWAGPNPIKDVLVGISIGVVLGLGWKQWQMHDKAERIRFYKEYDRLVKMEEETRRALLMEAKEEFLQKAAEWKEAAAAHAKEVAAHSGQADSTPKASTA